MLAGADAAIPAVAVTDTIKTIDRPVDAAPTDGDVVDTPDRARLVAVQTPQAFRADDSASAHSTGSDATDDAALVEAAGGTVVVVRGDTINRKITEPDDLEWARRHLTAAAGR